MESPPKRVTRARAAARATREPAVKTTKIVTAAAKAKTAPASSTKSTAAKRKTRADETDDEDDVARDELAVTRKPTRGRPRKAAEPEHTEAAKPLRGRPAKKVATEASKAQSAGPVRATRGRPKKNAEPNNDEPPPEPPRAARTRATATTASTRNKSSAAATKPTVKKSVKFEEPDKENVAPKTKKEPTKNEAATAGIRGRPARRTGPTSTAARSTRKTDKAADKSEKKPLSPKKVTQMPVVRGDESEDELAGNDFIRVKHMQKSPVKLPSSVVYAGKTSEATPEDQDDDATTTINNAILNPPDLAMGALASPARRGPSSALKDSMKSPARKIGAVHFPGSVLKSASKAGAATDPASPLKSSLYHSAAKRPPSPIKGFAFSSPTKSQQGLSGLKSSLLHSPAKRAVPGMKLPAEMHRTEDQSGVNASPSMPSLVATTPSMAGDRTPSEKLLIEDEPSQSLDDDEDEEPFQEPIVKISFPGRLSDVFPRDADPTLGEDMIEGLEESQPHDETVAKTEDMLSNVPIDQAQADLDGAEQDGESNSIVAEAEDRADEANDSIVVQSEIHDEQATDTEDAEDAEDPGDTIHVAVPEPATEPRDANYQLRARDLDPCEDFDSDSEDEAQSLVNIQPATPTALLPKKSVRRSTIGLTSLAEQFGSWSAATPAKDAPVEDEPGETETAETPGSLTDVSDTPCHFFEDEMQSHPADSSKEPVPVSQDPASGSDVEPAFDDVAMTNEDIALAREADAMAKLPAEKAEDTHNISHDESLSDASQEYGDENQMPVDSTIRSMTPQPPTTPERPRRHMIPNTTTKVPLKPADNSTPSPLKKRSFSASRIAPLRSSQGLSRSSKAPSLSPSKSRRASRASRRASAAPASVPTTPRQQDSSLPLTTPGSAQDIDPTLLQGAVVYVDAHTSDGGDASGLFMELLSKMGARCRKTWNWSPRNSSANDVQSNKVGITHVVYKDGRPQTLEKVRRAKGLVHCVGVSWVLDCERERKWLDEAPYYVDSSLLAQGGRRRKSMEPKALDNMNGTLVDSASRGNVSFDTQTPCKPMNRRDSTAWMRTPSDQGDQDQDGIEWSQFILTPVPKTPAPEAVARYAAQIPETPGGGDDEDTCVSPMMESLVTRTCPPKSKASILEIGQGLLNTDSDDHVMKRLMAAKRKSLQFAPKVASPLAKTWD